MRRRYPGGRRFAALCPKMCGMSADETEERRSPGPYSRMLGFRLLEATEDGVVLEGMPTDDHANGGGILHGGYLASLLDTTTGWAVHSALPGGEAAPHTHLSVQFLRAGMVGRPLTCRGRCVRAGRRVAAAEAEIVQDGTVIARAVTSHAVVTDVSGDS
jgi:acyl-CoA thioesterase